MKKISLLFFGMLLLYSCLGPKYKYGAEYEFGIKSISLNKHPVDIANMPKMGFQDDWIKIFFTPDKEGLLFRVENKVNQNIRLKWNESVFIIDNNPSKIYHQGVKFTDVSGPIQDTIIPPGTVLKNGAYPVSYLRFSSGWVADYIPGKSIYTKSTEEELPKFKKLIDSYDKKHLYTLILALEKEEVKREYLFDFEIASADIFEIHEK